jgi:hypothetical protein
MRRDYHEVYNCCCLQSKRYTEAMKYELLLRMSWQSTKTTKVGKSYRKVSIIERSLELGLFHLNTQYWSRIELDDLFLQLTIHVKRRYACWTGRHERWGETRREASTSSSALTRTSWPRHRLAGIPSSGRPDKFIVLLNQVLRD